MPRERLPMRKIRDVLRLHADRLSKRRIAVSVNLGRTAVRDYIKRATRVGLSWPLPGDLCDEALERLLFPPPIQGRKPRGDETRETSGLLCRIAGRRPTGRLCIAS